MTRITDLNDAACRFRKAASAYREAADYYVECSDALLAESMCPTLTRAFTQARDAAATMRGVNSHSGFELQRSLDLAALHIGLFHTEAPEDDAPKVTPVTSDEVH